MFFSRRIFWPCTLIVCLSILTSVLLPAKAAETEVLDLWQIRTPYGENPEGARSARTNIPVKTYEVQKGDTLWRIARVYKVDLKLLMAVNKLTKPEDLRAGSSLTIPLEPGAQPAVTQAEMKLASRGYFSLAWPLFGTVTSNFGWRKKEFHHGMDIAAKKGSPIKAVDAGKVIFSGWKNSIYGYAVLIDHGGGLKALYAHNSKNMVKKGQWVKAGQVIGLVGSTGRTTGPHLHLEILMDDKPVNPQRYLSKR